MNTLIYIIDVSWLPGYTLTCQNSTKSRGGLEYMRELWLEKHKICLAAVMDLFNWEYIAFTISDSPNQQLSKDTIEAGRRGGS
jgi:transposase InsO family protein